MNYIDTHIYTMKNLDELSEITDYSYGYLSVLFEADKAAVGGKLPADDFYYAG